MKKEKVAEGINLLGFKTYHVETERRGLCDIGREKNTWINVRVPRSRLIQIQFFFTKVQKQFSGGGKLAFSINGVEQLGIQKQQVELPPKSYILHKSQLQKDNGPKGKTYNYNFFKPWELKISF